MDQIYKQMRETKLVHSWTASKQESICEMEIFSSSATLYNFPFLYRAPSAAVKRPPVCSMGPIVLMFPGHICQASRVSCHSDPSNYIPIWRQRVGWNERQMDWQSGWIWKWRMLYALKLHEHDHHSAERHRSFLSQWNSTIGVNIGKWTEPNFKSGLYSCAVISLPCHGVKDRCVLTCTHASRQKVREDWRLTVRYVNVARLVHKSEDEASVHSRRWVLHAPTPRPQIYGGRGTQSLRHTFTFAESPSSIMMQHQGHPVFSDICCLTNSNWLTQQRGLLLSPHLCVAPWIICTLCCFAWYLLDSHTRPLHQDKCVIVC